MHNRALHDSLAAFVEEAAWQLAEEVSGGAEIPFELDATPTRSAPKATACSRRWAPAGPSSPSSPEMQKGV